MRANMIVSRTIISVREGLKVMSKTRMVILLKTFSAFAGD